MEKAQRHSINLKDLDLVFKWRNNTTFSLFNCWIQINLIIRRWLFDTTSQNYVFHLESQTYLWELSSEFGLLYSCNILECYLLVCHCFWCNKPLISSTFYARIFCMNFSPKTKRNKKKPPKKDFRTKKARKKNVDEIDTRTIVMWMLPESVFLVTPSRSQPRTRNIGKL